MRKYLYIAAIAALFIVVPAQAQQTITKPVIITMQEESFDMFKLYVANQDTDPDTVLETDITNEEAMAWIMDQMRDLLQQIQDDARVHALSNGRMDIISPDVISGGKAIGTVGRGNTRIR